MTRKNESRSRPVIIAPTMLVATNSTASSTIAKRIVAIIAPRSTERIFFIQQGDLFSQQLADATVMSNTARYTTAILVFTLGLSWTLAGAGSHNCPLSALV